MKLLTVIGLIVLALIALMFGLGWALEEALERLLEQP